MRELCVNYQRIVGQTLPRLSKVGFVVILIVFILAVFSSSAFATSYWIDGRDSNKLWFNTSLLGNETKHYKVEKTSGHAPNG